MRVKQSESELEPALSELRAQGWTADAERKTISRSFKFRDFSEAFGWMAQAALAAEKLNHHPDWFNSYNRVDVCLTTHSAGGITDLDIRLARKMNKI